MSRHNTRAADDLLAAARESGYGLSILVKAAYEHGATETEIAPRGAASPLRAALYLADNKVTWADVRRRTLPRKP